MLVLTPVSETALPTGQLAARPPSLAGLRLGIVDNRMPNSTALLRRLAGHLAASHGIAEVVWGDTFGAVEGRCDVILDGVGH